MRHLRERYPGWALVTGASSGIGAEFARQLAASGFSVVLTARRTEKLMELAEGLKSDHGVNTAVVSADLATEEGVLKVRDELLSREVSVFINNAGFGLKGPFVGAAEDRLAAMVRLNCGASMRLAHAAAGPMATRGCGAIVFVSSTAAFQGLPYSAAYAGTKAFVLLLSEGLHEELGREGVDVLALCPGPTDTEGPRRTGVTPNAVPTMMKVEPVVRAALLGLGRRAIVTPGLSNRIAAWSTRWLPRATVSRLAGAMLRRALDKSARRQDA